MAEPLRRPGIRALLLALLLPPMLALLAFDTWRDWRATSRALVEAYDQVLIEPVRALDDSLRTDADGRLQVAGAAAVQSMFEATQPRYKHLRVAASPLPASAGVDSANAETRTLLGPDDLPAPPPGLPGPDGTALFYDASYHGYPVRIAALRRSLPASGGSAGYRVLVQAAESTGARDRVLADAWQRALWSGLGMLLLMSALVWLGVALALRPLERLRRALADRTADDRAPLDIAAVPREVLPLAEALNHYIGEQGRLLAEQRRFLADASHQLRTPLAIMLAQAGFALREHEVEPMRESLRAISAQLARAGRLSEQLLSLAHASDAAHDRSPTPAIADLNAVARDVVLQYLPLAREKQQDLGWTDARGEDADADPSASPAAPVTADAAELHEALANLLHNAIRYTPPRGRITVAVRCTDAMVEAEVSDSGPGIAPADRAAVFERFVRRAPGATDADGGAGSGLGLAIARAYARRHRGEVLLQEAPGSTGLRAVLRLPRAGSNPISDNTYFEAGTAH